MSPVSTPHAACIPASTQASVIPMHCAAMFMMSQMQSVGSFFKSMVSPFT